MRLSIYSITDTLFDGEVEKIIARTSMGEITVLDGHIPLISSVRAGEITVEQGKERKQIQIQGGILEVQPAGRVILLAN